MTLPADDPRTIRGRKLGLSCCSHCGGTWNWRRTFAINFEKSRGCFPTCQECAKALSVDELIAYCNKVFVSWKQIMSDTEIEYARAELTKWHEAGRPFDPNEGGGFLGIGSRKEHQMSPPNTPAGDNIHVDVLEARLKEELPKMAHHMAHYLKGFQKEGNVYIDGEHERFKILKGNPLKLSWLFTLTGPVSDKYSDRLPIAQSVELSLTLSRTPALPYETEKPS